MITRIAIASKTTLGGGPSNLLDGMIVNGVVLHKQFL